jgi:hypothetical protein
MGGGLRTCHWQVRPPFRYRRLAWTSFLRESIWKICNEIDENGKEGGKRGERGGGGGGVERERERLKPDLLVS